MRKARRAKRARRAVRANRATARRGGRLEVAPAGLTAHIPRMPQTKGKMEKHMAEGVGIKKIKDIV